MEPPRSPPAAAADVQGQGGAPTAAAAAAAAQPVGVDQDTISIWDFLEQYCHIDVGAIVARAAIPAAGAAPVHTDVIDAHEDAPPQPKLGYDDPADVMLALRQPGQQQHTQGESTGFVAEEPVGMTTFVKMIKASYDAPTLAAEMLAAEAADPLQLTIGTHAPAINMLGSSSTTFSEGMCSGINLNLPPPENNETAVIPDNPKTDEPPYDERPLLGMVVGRKDPPPFVPVSILESSEVAKAAAGEHNAESFSQGAAGGGGHKKKMREPAHVADAAPAKRKRRYKWPANKMAKLDARIEQLRNEALLDPAHRRSLTLIQEKIDELQAQKLLVHAKMLDLMYGEGQGSSDGGAGDQHAPPSAGN